MYNSSKFIYLYLTPHTKGVNPDDNHLSLTNSPLPSLLYHHSLTISLSLTITLSLSLSLTIYFTINFTRHFVPQLNLL